jgi:class 3 adenylate cyclase
MHQQALASAVDTSDAAWARAGEQAVDQAGLAKKIRALAGFPELNPAAVERFGAVLAESGPWDLWRINPLLFGERHGIDPQESVGLFLHATKVGLFDFSWSLVCPVCGRLEHSYESINQVHPEHFHCTICQVDVPSRLDDYVEVSFTINPAVCRLDLDPYANLENFRRYFFTASIVGSAGELEYLKLNVLEFHALPPDQSLELDFVTDPAKTYELISLDQHRAVNFQPDPAAPRQAVQEVDLLPGGFAPETLRVAPGPIRLRLRNLTRRQTDMLLLGTDMARMQALLTQNPPRQLPMLSGKRLLNNQDFRNLYRVQDLKADLHLNIRSLTVVFTDLKGSTALYDRMGDAFAYNLIQNHFRVLAQAVRKHSGAIVKTMGDAVMATFSTPQEGVLATLEMARGLQALNAELEADQELGLKVGLHEGTVLAVNADERLDYFGQTVNIAARVQALAQAGEIWLTQPIFQAEPVAALLAAQGYREEQRQVRLKGVSDAATVYRMYR